MEAARIPWRPLGELFLARGLIGEEDLELALAEQAASGGRLGEILVRRNLISSPELTETLMQQIGREVATEEGFGSGLWAEIQRRTARPNDSPSLSLVAGDGDRSPFGSALGEAVAGRTAEDPALAHELEDLKAELGLVEAEPARVEAGPGQELPPDDGLDLFAVSASEHGAQAEELAQELEAALHELAAREQILAEELEARQGAVRQAEELRDRSAAQERRIDELEADLADYRGHLADVIGSLQDERDAHAEARRSAERAASEAADVRAQLDEARARVDELASGQTPEAAADEPCDYLCFAPGGKGYAILERFGHVPSPGAAVEVDGVLHVVTSVGRSPLPSDERCCAYLQVA